MVRMNGGETRSVVRMGRAESEAAPAEQAADPEAALVREVERVLQVAEDPGVRPRFEELAAALKGYQAAKQERRGKAPVQLVAGMFEAYRAKLAEVNAGKTMTGSPMPPWETVAAKVPEEPGGHVAACWEAAGAFAMDFFGAVRVVFSLDGGRNYGPAVPNHDGGILAGFKPSGR